MPRAASLAEKIKEVFNIEAELIKGSGGIYDIKVDGNLIFSRHANGSQFPKSDEAVIELIKGNE